MSDYRGNYVLACDCPRPCSPFLSCTLLFTLVFSMIEEWGLHGVRIYVFGVPILRNSHLINSLAD